MKGPPLDPGWWDITWPDQVAPRGQKWSSTRKIKPQTSNLHHLQHVPPIPLVTRPTHRVPKDTGYTDRDKQYHYPTPILQLANTLGHPANTKFLQRLEVSVRTPL